MQLSVVAEEMNTQTALRSREELRCVVVVVVVLVMVMVVLVVVVVCGGGVVVAAVIRDQSEIADNEHNKMRRFSEQNSHSITFLCIPQQH